MTFRGHSVIAADLSCKYSRRPGVALQMGFNQSPRRFYSAAGAALALRLSGDFPYPSAHFP